MPRLSTGEVTFPLLALRESAVTHNISMLSEFVATNNALLAPHIKTTMLPPLLQRQLAAGAWGFSVANVAQAAVAMRAGATRVLVANEIVGRQDARWLASVIRSKNADITCLVESPAGAQLLNDRLLAGGAPAPVDVLLEIGYPGGRTGCRDYQTARATARATQAAPLLRLVGVETYEGVVGHDSEAATVARVDAHLVGVRKLTLDLAGAGFFDSQHLLVSAGGMRYLDRVLVQLAPDRWSGQPVELLVRPGSYLLFGEPARDAGTAGALVVRGRRLEQAVEVWAEVLACPEPQFAIANIGKRNVAGPAALVPLEIMTPDETRAPAHEVVVRSLDDHHAYLSTGSLNCPVGSMLRFGVRYPTSLDRWPAVHLINDEEMVVAVWRTEF